MRPEHARDCGLACAGIAVKDQMAGDGHDLVAALLAHLLHLQEVDHLGDVPFDALQADQSVQFFEQLFQRRLGGFRRLDRLAVRRVVVVFVLVIVVVFIEVAACGKARPLDVERVLELLQGVRLVASWPGGAA